jgi:phosphate-selective porin OprO and OprP
MGNKNLIRAAVLAAVALPLAATAAEVSNEELLKRIEEQEQKILVLERKLEIQDESAASAKEATPVVSAGPKGFSLKSADGKSQLKFRGTLHLDGRWISGTDPGGTFDTFTATRVRPIFEGTFANIFDFKFMPDFGQGRTVIQDAYVNARFTQATQLQAGKFKAPIGLERLQSANDMRWVQRGFPTSLVTNRDIGLQLGGDLAGGHLSYQLAYLNGSNDGSSSETFADVDLNDDKEYAVRLFAQPFAESGNFALRGLGFGIAGSWNDQVGSATQPLLPSFRTPGQSTFFRYRAAGTTAGSIADGERFRLAPQFYYYVGALGVLGEYTEVEQDVSRVVATGLREATVDTNAWQLAVSYFLTGEEASYKGFQPKTRFSPSEGTWGAFEIKARVQQLNVDDNAFAGGADSFADPLASASQADSYGIGLNWYLNENLKWLLDIEHTTFEGGAATGDRKDEDAYQLRLAIAF